jgi:hypothetical protein
MAPTNWVPKMSARYAGIVANPPPYIDAMMQNDSTKSASIFAENEEDEVRHLAAQLVRPRRPRDAAEDVEQRDEPDEACADGSGRRGHACVLLHVEVAEIGRAGQHAAERFLQHGRGCADDADAGRHVHAKCQPQ